MDGQIQDTNSTSLLMFSLTAKNQTVENENPNFQKFIQIHLTKICIQIGQNFYYATKIELKFTESVTKKG